MPDGRSRAKIVCIFNYASHYRKLIYNLMANKFDCDFYFGANLPSGQSLKKMNLDELPGFKMESRVYGLRYVWQRNVVLQAFKGYEIYILTGQPSLSNIVFMVFATLFRKKVFLWTHGFKRLEEGRHPLVRFLYMNATGYFLYGNYGREMMRQYGIPEERLFVIYNSLDYDFQLKIRKDLTLSAIYKDEFNNDDPVIIFSGRLQSEKKLDYILNAMSRLRTECPFNLVIIGDGPKRDQLNQLAKQLGLVNRIWFFGPCYDEETLGKLFYNATLTVSPGNVGLTAIHSMMYGTPVLTHSTISNQGPEVEAVIPGETGLLFKEDDIASLASSIRKCITLFNKKDVVQASCYSVIDNYYNPHYSIRVISDAINKLCFDNKSQV